MFPALEGDVERCRERNGLSPQPITSRWSRRGASPYGYRLRVVAALRLKSLTVTALGHKEVGLPLLPVIAGM